MTGFQQGAFQAMANVKWTGGGWIVVTTSRDHHTHGNGIPAAPPIDLSGISEWDAYYEDFDINWTGIRRTFPGNTEPPPKRSDLQIKLPNGSPNPAGPVLRWGGFDQPDYGGVGPVGAQVTKRPKPTLVGTPQPPDFTDDGYTDGKVIHDLVVFNVPAIKAITGKEEFTFELGTLADIAIPDGGSTVTSKKIYFPWGSGGEIGTDIFPFDYPVFPPANGGTTGYPNWDAIHPNYKYKGLAQVSNVSVILAWILNNINTGLPDAEYPPYDFPSVPTSGSPNDQVVMQAMVDYANRTFNEGPTFFLGEGTAFYTGGQPAQQVESNYTIRIDYYSKPPIDFAPGTSGPNDPVPFFPVASDNSPLWNLGKADQTITRTFGGRAPQPGRTIKVKLTKNPSTGKQLLTAEVNIETP